MQGFGSKKKLLGLSKAKRVFSVFLSGTLIIGSLIGGIAAPRTASADPSPPTFIPAENSISRGYNSTLMFDKEGYIWGWGLNTNGELGDGTIVNKLVPTKTNIQVPNIKQIVGGDGHTVYLTEDGKVFTMGSNDSGQLGNGTTGGRSTVPVEVVFPEPVVIKEVASYSKHTLALDEAGDVWSWGSNSLGQLGRNPGDPTPKNLPGRVYLAVANVSLGSSKAKSIGTGVNTSYAVMDNGNVAGWGHNGYKQVADSNSSSFATPVVSQKTGNITKVRGAAWGTVGLTSSGGLISWGTNNNLSLGQPSPGTYYPGTTIAGASGVKDFVMGNTQVVMLLNNGTLMAFGDTSRTGTHTTSSGNISTPMSVLTVKDVVALGGGTFHTIALQRDGKMYVWGNGNNGQLGMNDTSGKIPPTLMTNTIPLYLPPGQLTSLSHSGLTDVGFRVTWAGGSGAKTFTLKVNDEVKYTGANMYFDLVGLSQNTTYKLEVIASNDDGSSAPRTLEVTTKLSAVQNFSVKKTSSSSTIVKWDPNPEAETYTLKRGATQLTLTDPLVTEFVDTGIPDSSTQTYTIVANKGVNTSAVVSKTISLATDYMTDFFPRIYMDEAQVSYVDADGNLWPWGWVEVETDTRNKPAKLVNFPGIKSAAGSGAVQFLLKEDGTVWAYGRNSAMMGLGLGDLTNKIRPVQIPGLANISSIAVAPSSRFALNTSGVLFGWGGNTNGHVGNGTKNEVYVPTQILTGVKYVSSGTDATLALKTDGTVWGWGAKESLGLSGTGRQLTPVSLGITGASQVSMGGSFGLVLKGGEVYSFGKNNVGQLGLGDTLSKTGVQKIPGLTGVIQVAAGNTQAAAVKSDGTVWAWGNSWSHQPNTPTPKQVQGLSNITAIDVYDAYIAINSSGEIFTFGKNNMTVIGDENLAPGAYMDTPFKVTFPYSDVTAPTLSFSIAPDVAGKSKVTVTPTDVESGWHTIKYEKGTHEKSYFLTGGTKITTPATSVVLDNETYTFYARDFAGNQVIQTYVVGDDTTPPTITATPAAPVNGTVVVTVTATDASGVAGTKWATGDQNVVFFETQGTSFTDYFSVTENGDYTVYAIDSLGNAAVQKVTVAGIVTPPATPTGLTAVANGTDGANLSWNIVPGAVSYEVIRNGSVVGTVSAPPFSDGGLTANTTYSYSVVAVDGNGVKGSAATTTVKTDPEAPATPTNFAQSDLTASSVKLGWDAVNGVDGYIVSDANGQVYKGPDLTFSPINLSPETTYTFTLVSYIGTKISITPSTITITTPPAPLAAPTGLTVTSVTENSVGLAWNPVDGADSYEASRSSQSVYSNAATKFEDTGLSASTNYIYTVVAKKGSVTSPPAIISVTTSAYVPVPAPINFVVTGVTETTASFGWVGSPTVTTDTYTLKRGPQEVYIGPGNGFTDVGLMAGTTYVYTLTVQKDGKDSLPITLTVVTLAHVPVPKPSVLIANEVTDSSVELSWPRVAGVDSYLLKQGAQTIYSGQDLIYKGTHLKPGTSYTFVLYAVRGTELSDPVTVTVTTHVRIPLAPPAIFFKTSSTESTIEVMWSAVEGADSYELRRGTEFVTSGNILSYENTGLVADTSYVFSVVAKRGSEVSTPAVLVASTNKAVGNPPEKPTGLKVLRLYPTAVATQWNQVPGSTFKLIRDESVVVYHGNLTTFKDENLTGETDYSYKVIAQNEFGQTISETIIAKTLPEQPTIAVSPSEPVTGAITFSFKVLDDGFEYTVDRNPSWYYAPQGDGTYHKTYFNSVTGESRDYGFVRPIDGMLGFIEENVDPSKKYHYDITAFRVRTDGTKEAVGESKVEVETPADNSGGTISEPIEGGKYPSENGNGNGTNPGNGNGSTPDDSNGGNEGTDPGNNNGSGGNGNGSGGTGGNVGGPGSGGTGGNGSVGTGGAGGSGTGSEGFGTGGNTSGSNGGAGTDNSNGSGSNGENTNGSGPESGSESVNPKDLSDLKDHWSEEAVTYLVTKGIITGYEDNTFKPDQSITRAEFTTMLVKSLASVLQPGSSNPFDDVTANDWHFKTVSAGWQADLVRGVADAKFAPDMNITREQMFAIIGRGVSLLDKTYGNGVTEGKISEILSIFSDVESISDWARVDIAKAVNVGLISGNPDKTVSPLIHGTRAEAAMLIYGLLTKYVFTAK